MLRINRETDYAVRVILALAQHDQEAVIPSGDIRREMDLPDSLSLQIIAQLVKTGFLNSYPGRRGGIQLARPAAEINLLEVVNAFQGPLQISECLDEPESCSLAPGCPVRGRWENLQQKIEVELSSTSFDVLAAEAVQGSPAPELVPQQS